MNPQVSELAFLFVAAEKLVWCWFIIWSTDQSENAESKSEEANEHNKASTNTSADDLSEEAADLMHLSKPTIEISSLIIQNELLAENNHNKSINNNKSLTNESGSPRSSCGVQEAAANKQLQEFDAEETQQQQSSNAAGLHAILAANLSEVISQQLSPLLESANLPGVNLAAATSKNGTLNLTSLQQQLAIVVAQIAGATQLLRNSGGNTSQQRALQTASLLAAQLSAAAGAAAAVVNSSEGNYSTSIFSQSQFDCNIFI